MCKTPRLPKKPSYNRRAAWHDYRSPASYMITMTKEQTTPELSLVRNVGSFQVPSPQVDLTYYGEIVFQALRRLHEAQPSIVIVRNIIMPDHLHLLLRVTDRLPKHIGTYIGAMAGDCTRRMSELNPSLAGRPFFISGFNDRIITKAGQTAVLTNYIVDNPRRLMMKRLFPKYFRQACVIEVEGRKFSAFGNLYLLKCPEIAAVRYSSKFAPEEFGRLREGWLEIARGGGVLVSPFIHTEEKRVREEALEIGGRIICLKDNGFGKRYKPHGRDFDLCLEGRLLEIAPLVHRTERVDLRRSQALIMNEWAALIAALPPEAKMVIKHGRGAPRS